MFQTALWGKWRWTSHVLRTSYSPFCRWPWNELLGKYLNVLLSFLNISISKLLHFVCKTMTCLFKWSKLFVYMFNKMLLIGLIGIKYGKYIIHIWSKLFEDTGNEVLFQLSHEKSYQNWRNIKFKKKCNANTFPIHMPVVAEETFKS